MKQPIPSSLTPARLAMAWACCAALFTAGSPSPRAQTWTGGGPDNSWIHPSNWNPTSTPNNNGAARIIFTGAIRVTPTNTLPWDLSSIVFDAQASEFTLSGDLLGLRNGLENQSSQTQIIENSIRLLAPQNWSSLSQNLSLHGDVSLGNNVLNLAGGGAFTFLAGVSGAGGFNKQGPGALRLTASNSFSGGIALRGGTLELGNPAALGTGPLAPFGGVVRAQTAPLTFTNSLLLPEGATASFDGPWPLAFSGGAVFTGNRVLQTASNAAVTLSGSLSGANASASLTKTGPGQLILSGDASNNLSGFVAVAAGELTLAKPNGLESIMGSLGVGGSTNDALVKWQASHQIADASAIGIGTLGRLDLNGFSEKIRTLQLNNGTVATGLGTLTVSEGISATAANAPSRISGNLDLNGATQVFSPQNGPADPDLLIDASISNGALTKLGPGTLVLAGSNSFAGGILIDAGVLGIAHNQAAGVGPINLGAGRIQSQSNDINLTNLVRVGCWDCKPGDPSDPVFSGTNDLTFSGPVILGGIPLWTVENQGKTIFSGSMSEDEPGRGWIKGGLGTLVLGGAQTNSYTGPTAVREGVLELAKSPGTDAIIGELDIGSDEGVPGDGIVRLAASDQIRDSSRIRIRRTGVLDLNGFSETGTISILSGALVTGAGKFTLASGLTSGLGAGTAGISGNLDLGGVLRAFNVGDGPAATDMAILASVSNGGIHKLGSGRLLLGGSNTFAGGLLIEQGSVGLGHDQALGTGPLYLASSDAALIAEGGPRSFTNTVVTHATMTFGGTNDFEMNGEVILTGKNFFIVTNAASTLTVSRSITEDAAGRRIVKQGAGRLILAGSNAFTGGVELEGGTLELRHPNSLAQGFFTVFGGEVILGKSDGPVITGTTVFTTNAVLRLALNQPSTNALLRVQGRLTLAGRIGIDPGADFGPGTYRLLDYTGQLDLRGLTFGNAPSNYKYALIAPAPGQIDLAVAPAEPAPGVTLQPLVLRPTGAEISFVSDKGRVYLLEMNTVLSASGWVRLARVVGDGRLLILRDPSLNTSQRYYRIITEQ